MRHVFLIFAAVVLSGCGTARHSPTHETSRESVTVNARQLDSIVARLARTDSVFVRDSVSVTERGDTVFKYVERVRYRYMERMDTVSRRIVAHDTVYVERRDSVTREGRPRGEIETWLTLTGALCSIAVVAWLLNVKREK